MFRKGYELWKKHKGKALVVGVISGGVYAYNNNETVRNYVDDSWSWVWNKLSLEENPILQSMAHDGNLPTRPTNLSRRANNGPSSDADDRMRNGDMGYANCESIKATIVQLLEKAMVLVDELLSIDQLRQQLASRPENKLQIWEEIKVVSWSRCFVGVYLVCYLVAYIQVEAAVSGCFLSSQSQANLSQALTVISEHMKSADFPVNQGLCELIKVVRSVVTKPLATIPLQENLSMAEIKIIIFSVRQLIETRNDNAPLYPTSNFFLEFVVPPEELDPHIERQAYGEESASLAGLSNNLLAVLKSVDCKMVVSCCLEMCFLRMLQELNDFLKERTLAVSSRSDTTTASMKLEERTLPHAAFLPVVSRLCNLFIGPESSPILQELIDLPYHKTFVERIVRGEILSDTF